MFTACPSTFLCAALAACIATTGAADSAADESPLFRGQDVLAITLQGPLTTTWADSDHRKQQSFLLRSGPDGSPDFVVDVRLRGKSRTVLCDQPPLRLKFDEATTGDTVFRGQDRLKLVLPCQDKDRSEQDLLSEYLAYRIFGLLSEQSYRVRLLRLRLVDTDQPGDPQLMDRHAFVIESNRELSERTGLAEVNLPTVRRGDFVPDQAALVFIFQYLVGNTDWSLVAAADEKDCCHNLRLFGAETRLYAVPFDFDQSGLVNAPYAKPDPGLRLRTVRQRRYRGYCIDPAALGPALDRILAQQDAIEALSRSLPVISERTFDKAVAYVEDFFDKANDSGPLLNDFQKRCL